MSTKLQKQARQDLDTLLKLAAAGPGARAQYALNQYLWGFAKPLLGTLAAVGASAGAAYYFTKKDKERHREELLNSMKSLALKSPQFAKNPDDFFERFGELTVISPTIAKNPTLAAKLLDKKLKSGFTVDDIHKLTSIEHNTASTRSEVPGAAARASAGHALTTLVNAFGRDAVEYKKELDKDYGQRVKGIGKAQKQSTKDMIERELAKATEDVERRGGPLDKESSAQRVSDECLGQMLAERYVLIKQAGLMSEGFKNMGKGLQIFAPAMALAGGVELVRQAIESRRNKSLEAQADKNFASMMRTNDKLKGEENKHLAHEAFETLKAVAPSLAARPLVAQTFIEYTVGQGQLAPQTVQQLAEAEDKVRGIGSKGSFFTDLKSTMGIMDTKKISEIESSSNRYSFRKRK